MAITYKYGIDFGTTNSSIALHYDVGNNGVMENCVFKVDQNLISKELLPSMVYIDAMGETCVGTRGKNKYASDDLPKDLKHLDKKVKLKLDEFKDDVVVVKFAGRSYKVSDIIALIIKELKAKADKEHTVKTNGIVFGVPVNYNDSCKRVMLEATVKAKLYKNLKEAEEAVDFLDEPIAVALDYGLNLNSDKNVFVFDFGGGTLDLAIVRLVKSDDEKGRHEVIGKHRITLGGEQYTELFFKKAFIPKYGRMNLIQAFGYDHTLSVDELWERLGNDSLGVQFIDALDKAKCELSYEDDNIFSWAEADANRFVKINCELTRSELEKSISDSFNDIRIAIQTCLSEAHITSGNIDEVLMAGGSSLIPAIIGVVKSVFGDKKVRNPSNNALTSIVKGLAVKGYQEDGNEWVDDIVGSTYGLWIEHEQRIEPIIKKNTRVEDTHFDRENVTGGKSLDVRSINDKIPEVMVYQNNEKIGQFSLPHKGSGYFRIYYEIDKKHGWLIVHIFDRKTLQWYDDILEHNVIQIK